MNAAQSPIGDPGRFLFRGAQAITDYLASKQVGGKKFTRAAVYRMIENGQLSVHRIGNHRSQIYAKKSDLDALFEASVPEPSDEFTISEIAGLSAEMLNIPPQHFTKHLARLKNLVRLGLVPPRGSRGKTAHYTKEEAFDLALGVLLNWSELMPERVVYLMGRRRESVRQAGRRGKYFMFHPENIFQADNPNPRKHKTVMDVWPSHRVWRAVEQYMDRRKQ